MRRRNDALDRVAALIAQMRLAGRAAAASVHPTYGSSYIHCEIPSNEKCRFSAIAGVVRV